jgi:hypothetical protein
MCNTASWFVAIRPFQGEWQFKILIFSVGKKFSEKVKAMEIGKHVAVAILLLFSYPSQAQYIGIGQQGIEAGKELERHDLRISFAFDAAHFSTVLKHISSQKNILDYGTFTT